MAPKNKALAKLLSKARPRVVSFSDGIGTARHMLHNAGFNDVDYNAYEINPKSMQLATWHYPDIKQHGDMLNYLQLGNNQPVDLLTGGTPCQSVSRLGKQDGFMNRTTGKPITSEAELREALTNGDNVAPSSFFWPYVGARDYFKPKHFLYENVASMKPKYRDAISEQLGTEPVLVGNLGVSDRPRYVWTDLMDQSEYAERTRNVKPKSDNDIVTNLDIKREPAKLLPKQYIAGADQTDLFGDQAKNGYYVMEDRTGYTRFSKNAKGRTRTLPASGRMVVYKNGQIYTPADWDYVYLSGLENTYKPGSGISLNNIKQMIGNGWDVHDLQPFFDKFAEEYK